MKIEIIDAKTLAPNTFDLLISGFYEGSEKAPKEFGELNQDFVQTVLSAAQNEGFTGVLGKSFLMHGHAKDQPRMVALIGTGKKSEFEVDSYRKIGGLVYKLANDKRSKKVGLFLPKSKHVEAQAAILATLEGFQLAKYRFDKYLTENKTGTYVEEFCLIAEEVKRKDGKNTIHEAEAIVHGVCLARDLINEGANAITPKQLAAIATKEAKASGLDVEVLDEAALAKENMNLMLAVARASMDVTPPRLVRLSYRPKGKPKKHIVLVGKGVTFDSGGLDIKNAEGMRDMKVDMSGAACVLGTLLAIGKLKPDVAVTGYMVCVENGIGAKAYHPGDVIKSRKGLTVEIDNTDAEGRLILADALDYAQSREDADVYIDIATLTGACMIALGALTAGVFTDNDKLAESICESGKRAGEDFWRLPLNENLRDQLKSSVADMKNSGGRMGGAITAGLFLKKFIGEKGTWAHLDIAGPATNEKDHAYIPKGGAGFAVRTLADYICNS